MLLSINLIGLTACTSSSNNESNSKIITLHREGSAKPPVYISVDHIVAMIPEGNRTRIDTDRYGDYGYYNVIETPEEILALIGQ